MKWILVLTTLIMSLTASADMVIITYNMAQLKKHGADLVPCTNRRINPQMENLLLLPEAPIHKEKYFALALQEIWTKKAFNALKKAVDKMGYSMFPLDQKKIAKNGVITVTNLKILEASFTPYTRDTYAEKGILYVLGESKEGRKIGIINVHTGFSGVKEPSSTHLRQFYEIGEFVMQKKSQSDYFVVAGDFNAGPDMIYDKQKYEVADTIWNKGIIPVMDGIHLKHVPIEGVTWDQSNNPLVYNPAFLLKAFNLYDHGNTGWGQNDSTMDHIFITDTIEMKESGIVFREPVPLHCPKRTSADGKSTLSDHYGVMAVITDKVDEENSVHLLAPSSPLLPE